MDGRQRWFAKRDSRGDGIRSRLCVPHPVWSCPTPRGCVPLKESSCELPCHNASHQSDALHRNLSRVRNLGNGACGALGGLSGDFSGLPVDFLPQYPQLGLWKRPIGSRM